MTIIIAYERRHTIANGIAVDIDIDIDDNIDCNGNYNDYLLQQQNILTNVGSESILRQWKVNDEDVTELPEIYPRLSSALIVRGGCAEDDDTNNNVSLVGKRLWNFLHVNSVRSVYDSKRARVFCYTSRASFVVQFWRRRKTDTSVAATDTDTDTDTSTSTSTSTSSSEEEIILEVQRRQGCSYTMHKIRTALKKSIQCSTSNSNSNSTIYNEPKIIPYEILLLQQTAQQRTFKPTAAQMMMVNNNRLIQIRQQQRRRRWSAPPTEIRPSSMVVSSFTTPSVNCQLDKSLFTTTTTTTTATTSFATE